MIAAGSAGKRPAFEQASETDGWPESAFVLQNNPINRSPLVWIYRHWSLTAVSSTLIPTLSADSTEQTAVKAGEITPSQILENQKKIRENDDLDESMIDFFSKVVESDS